VSKFCLWTWGFKICECATKLVDRDQARQETRSRIVPSSRNVLSVRHEIEMKKDHIYCFIAMFIPPRKYSSTHV
jgi:hypothetical protein